MWLRSQPGSRRCRLCVPGLVGCAAPAVECGAGVGAWPPRFESVAGDSDGLPGGRVEEDLGPECECFTGASEVEGV
jgi:hypothetical protein